MAAFPRIQTSDKDLQLIQDNIDKTFSPILSMPMAGGNVLASIVLVTGQDNLIAHKLGRKARYFIVINQNADATVWNPISTALGNAQSDTQFINLQCSADCTVTLWVN